MKGFDSYDFWPYNVPPSHVSFVCHFLFTVPVSHHGRVAFKFTVVSSISFGVH
jgi:hypothetical protein